MKKINIISYLILTSLLLPSLTLIQANNNSTETNKKEAEIKLETQVKVNEATKTRLENQLNVRAEENGLETRNKEINAIQERLDVRAKQVKERLMEREGELNEIRARIASSSIKMEEKVNERLAKQREQMVQVRTRLINKEIQVISVLGKIFGKINERISILENQGLDMTKAKIKLAETEIKINEITNEANKLTDLASIEVTEENQTQLFTEIKTGQERIRTMAKSIKAFMVEIIKEITKVLPTQNSTETNPQ